jgi:hypothetical protein
LNRGVAAVALEGSFAIVRPVSNHLRTHMSTYPDNEGEGGTMDISEHVKTWEWFTWAVKWTLILNVLVLALLAIFRTHS